MPCLCRTRRKKTVYRCASLIGTTFRVSAARRASFSTPSWSAPNVRVPPLYTGRKGGCRVPLMTAIRVHTPEEFPRDLQVYRASLGAVDTPDPVTRLNAALQCEIGEGVRATVYLAKDLKHNRNVLFGHHRSRVPPSSSGPGGG